MFNEDSVINKTEYIKQTQIKEEERFLKSADPKSVSETVNH